ncbi:MAG: hypothetical protein KDH09_08405, partial [Chrysiogenetes bacterium]|nr:hypothetical protein [Chrysiogenetes bacterium]
MKKALLFYVVVALGGCRELPITAAPVWDSATSFENLRNYQPASRTEAVDVLEQTLPEEVLAQFRDVKLFYLRLEDITDANNANRERMRVLLMEGLVPAIQKAWLSSPQSPLIEWFERPENCDGRLRESAAVPEGYSEMVASSLVLDLSFRLNFRPRLTDEQRARLGP